MQATKLRVTVPPDRRLTVQLPDDVTPGEVELLILQDAKAPGHQALQTLLRDIESSDAPGHSLKALNQRLSEERSQWE